MTSRLRVALVQMFTKWPKSDNVKRAETLVGEAANNGAKLVTLPEYYTCVLDPEDVKQKAEESNGETAQAMSEMAKKHGIFLVGGSLPIIDKRDLNKVRNACFIYNPKGEVIGEQSKMHMFDVNLGPHYHITESDFTLSGNHFTCFDTGVCKVGVGICMDVRYPEVSRLYTEKGCKLLIFLGAFSAHKTGPAHWEVLQRARAIDNQVYVMTASPARDDTHPYVVYGHSSIVNPWGKIISSAKEDEEIVYADIDMDFVDEVRAMLPLENIRRKDMYEVVDLSNKS